MHGPHDPEGWSSDLIKGLPACDHLPKNNAPTEHVTLLAVVTAYRPKIEKKKKKKKTGLLTDRADAAPKNKDSIVTY